MPGCVGYVVELGIAGADTGRAKMRVDDGRLCMGLETMAHQRCVETDNLAYSAWVERIGGVACVACTS